MTFVVQTQINVIFNDRQSEFNGFEPLTVGLTLRVDLDFRDQIKTSQNSYFLSVFCSRNLMESR